MRRMYTENQIKKLAKFVAENNLGDVDLNVASINAKGLAITGAGAITGNLAVGSDIASNGVITGDSIIENMSGYSFVKASAQSSVEYNVTYAGVVKNGNKITLALSFELTRTASDGFSTQILGHFVIPEVIYNKLVNNSLGRLDNRQFVITNGLYTYSQGTLAIDKQEIPTGKSIRMFYVPNSSQSLNETYIGRVEETFLLGENLAPSEE